MRRGAERRFPRRHPWGRLAVLSLAGALAAFAPGGDAATSPESVARPAIAARATQVRTIHYRAHNGARRAATVLLPAWYRRGSHTPIPLIISPHGRGRTGRSNAAIWGDLPTRGPFAVVNPDGHGRRLPRHSWGYRGQIEDLARMPRILRRALPWLRIDRAHIYAFGGSMGGQETLLLVARHPRLLAGAAVFDSVADLRLQYRRFPRLPCNNGCRRMWAGSIGVGLQTLARLEVGGSPANVPRAYAARSPMAHAREIAFSCVPLQIWWSIADRVVVGQRQQSGRLFAKIKHLNPKAPVSGFVGAWIHSTEMRARARLPLALAEFDLLSEPPPPPPPRLGMIAPPAASHSCRRSR
jgi:pimeloyl-ACP methyl ester carboxylesterase